MMLKFDTSIHAAALDAPPSYLIKFLSSFLVVFLIFLIPITLYTYIYIFRIYILCMRDTNLNKFPFIFVKPALGWVCSFNIYAILCAYIVLILFFFFLLTVG